MEAARLRGSNPIEVRLAARIIGNILGAENISELDPGAFVSADRTEVKSAPFMLSISPRPCQEDIADPSKPMIAAMDTDAQVKAHQRAQETAVSRISKARTLGASLYLINIEAEDFAPVMLYARDMVEQWLDGYLDLTTDFRRRVRLAEAAYCALCEALLNFDPKRGVRLWQALRATVMTKYIGAADVEDLLHMIFRVSDSSEVTALRDKLIELEESNTDEALFNIAIAALYNGKSDWLSTVIKVDLASSHIWKRRRGMVLAGFTAFNELPVTDAWPDGEIKTGYKALECESARSRWVEACAHHWWKMYLTAKTTEKAYAAWVLFLRSADRRAWIWMHEDIRSEKNASSLFKSKLDNVKINRSKLKREMKKRTKHFEDNFLNCKIVQGVGPWYKYSGYSSSTM